MTIKSAAYPMLHINLTTVEIRQHSPDLKFGVPLECLSFQMVSLLHLSEIKEEGVTFRSPVDNSLMLLTPEHSMAIQNRLGEGALVPFLPFETFQLYLNIQACDGSAYQDW